MKIMFIDDNEESVLDARDEVLDNIEHVDSWIENFGQGLGNIEVKLPDIVVLDVWDGKPQESDPFGLEIMNRIWMHNFCPVIIYSADSKIISDVPEYNHPFIEIIAKGAGSDEKVREAVERFVPHVEALQSSHSLVSRAFSLAMRDIAPDAFNTFSETEEFVDAVVRGGRRRVAALMDETLPGVEALASWEQYLAPPVSQDIRLGDILRSNQGDPDDPAAFRIVLTPSCDMVSTALKVEFVLVAKCCEIGLALHKCQIGLSERSIKRSNILTQGFYNAYIPFPKLPGKIPAMTADLRDLELIPVGSIGVEEDEFLIVASVDSPFRELVSWAYLQVAGRPGLPQRDLNGWIQDIIEAVNIQRGSETN